MKIAIISNPIPRHNKSPLHSLKNLASLLIDKYDVGLYAGNCDKKLLDDLPKISVFTCFLTRYNKFFYQFKFIRFLKKERPDVALFWIADKMTLVMSYLKRRGVPTIYWLYGNTYNEITNKVKKMFSIFCLKHQIKKADYLASEHSGVFENFPEFGNMIKNKKSFEYLSICANDNINKILPAKKNSDFICISRLALNKNLETCFDAFIEFAKKINVKLYVLGSGPDEKFLKQKYSNGKIIFCGWKEKEEKKFYLEKCKFLISPSTQEGFPSSVQEGIQNKCLVIAYPAGGLRKFLVDGENAIIIRSNRVVDFVESFRTAYNLDDNKVESILGNALVNLNSSFSKESCKRKIINAIDNVLENKTNESAYKS